jgi:hypothetical protein
MCRGGKIVIVILDRLIEIMLRLPEGSECQNKQTYSSECEREKDDDLTTPGIDVDLPSPPEGSVAWLWLFSSPNWP